MSKLYGLIGFPVKHSYSAIMHNALFKELGIDARYELFEIKPENLAEQFKQLIARGGCGFNITVPYKEKIIELITELDDRAQLIGAVNTIKVNDDKTTKGFNTDGAGFLKHLTEVVGFQPKGKRISILGAGGAAKAVSTEMAGAGAKRIALFDLEQQRAQQLAAKLKDNFADCQIQIKDQANALLEDQPDLLVNATPVGLHRQDSLVFDAQLLGASLVVYDLIYNPAETALLKAARERRCAGIFNGLGMLIYQGVLAFKIWLEVEPPAEIMEEAIRKVLSGVGND